MYVFLIFLSSVPHLVYSEKHRTLALGTVTKGHLKASLLIHLHILIMKPSDPMTLGLSQHTETGKSILFHSLKWVKLVSFVEIKAFNSEVFCLPRM